MPPTNYTTFRVRGIPAGSSREEFRALVGQVVSCDVSGVRIRSLACDPARLREMVATIAFADTPVELSGDCGQWSIETSDEVTLVFDIHFHGCTTLYCPPTDQWKFDLIAISGLNGHAFGSFKKKNDSYMWLCDSLPRDFPRCRIIIYGYDTRLQDSKSFQNILDIGKKFQNALRQVRRDVRKPLILLGHSLGGIVIKESITLMRMSDVAVDKLNFAAIKGVVFFGVPNQGMDIYSLIPMVGEQANRGFLHTLEHNSPVLRTQAQEFSATMAKLRCDTLNFYETQESPTATRNEDGTWSMSGPPAVLVNAYSATHGRLDDAQGHRVHPIDCGHSDLVKFSSAYDEPYATVIGFLQEIGEHKPAVMTELEEGCFQSLSFLEQDQRMDSFEPAANTCGWLITHNLFTKWLEKPQGLLWIRGIPGSGKSMAMKQVLRLMKDSSKEAVASFFIYSQGKELQRSVLGVYRSLLHQVYFHAPDCFSNLTKRFEEYKRASGTDEPDKKWSWMKGEIRQNLLEGLPQACRKIPIIILVDALDEAGEDQAREIFKDMETLMDLSKDPACRLSVCLSCRHYPDISFSKGTTIVMENLNGPDIEQAVDLRLTSEDIFSDWEKDQIKEEVLNRSEGIFLWTSLVTETIVRMRRRGDSFQSAMRNVDHVPGKLNDLYTHVLQRGDEPAHEIKQRSKLFQWVFCAAEPLSSEELQHALAFDLGMASERVSNDLETEEFSVESDFELKVRNLSRGLIGLYWYPHFGCRVEFIHKSVFDFLADHGGMALVSDPCTSDPVRLAHFEVARSCLSYMLLERIREDLESNQKSRYFKLPDTSAEDSCSLKPKRRWRIILPDRAFSEREAKVHRLQQEFPLISYAWSHWIFHIAGAKGHKSSQDEDYIDAELLKVFQWPRDELVIELWYPLHEMVGSPFRSWIRDFHPDPSFIQNFGLLATSKGLEDRMRFRVPRLIHVLALTGLLSRNLQKTIYSKDHFAIIKKSRGGSPLNWAIMGQQKEVIRNLIATGDRGGRHALYWADSSIHLASMWGDTEVLSLLLNHGHSHSARAWIKRSNNPFIQDLGRWARDIEVFKLLLNHGHFHSADVWMNRSDNPFRSAPRIWTRVWEEHCWTPLHIAALSGKVAAMQMLITSGAKIPAPDGDVTPLHLAAATGQNEAIKVLSQSRPNVNLKIRTGRTPLSLAINSRQLDTVRLLLELGANVNGKDINISSLVSSNATKEKDKPLDILRLLIEHGADVNIPFSRESGPLCTAVESGWTDAVRLLVANGADVNPGVPLYKAVSDGDGAIVLLLLNAGADANARNYQRKTPLELATKNGNKDIAQMLIEHGADIKLGIGDTRAMRFAVKSDNLALVELLLESGVDVNEKCCRNEGLLFLTCAVVNPPILERLLRAGADPNSRDSRGETALFCAAAQDPDHRFPYRRKKDCIASITLLLKFGADPSITSPSGRTARSYAIRNKIDEIDKLLKDAGCPKGI